MWLITTLGFFSIVCKPGDKKQGMLTVRSRVKSDLEELRKNYLPGLGTIVEGAGTDYRICHQPLELFAGQAHTDDSESIF